MNETSVGNVSFRNIPAEKRVGLRIGGVGLTLQQPTWNFLVRLAEDIGVIQSDAERQSDTIDSDISDDDSESIDATGEDSIEDAESA